MYTVIRLAPVRTVAPTGDIVTLDEAKQHCRVDHDDDDGVLAALLMSASQRLDGYNGIVGQAMLDQTWRQDFGGFEDCMRLPVGPLRSITSVIYRDLSDAQRTLSTSVYQGLTDVLGPFITLKTGQSWPATYWRRDAVSATFVAGFGDAAEDVPQPLRQAIISLAAHWYQNREAIGLIPDSVAELIAPFKGRYFA